MGPNSVQVIASSEVLKYILVVGMGCLSHTSLHVPDRSSFPRVTTYLWAATLSCRLERPAYAQFIGPNIFSGVYFWLPNGLVLVHLKVVVAVKAFRPEVVNCLVYETLRGAQQALLVEHANHVPARLLVHHNVIATLLRVKQHFMRPAFGSSNVRHVVHSGAA